MLDGPILVAPRPVRVAAFPPPSPVQWTPVASPTSDSPLARLEQMSLNDNGLESQNEINISMSSRELSPVRMSPNPAEAWDEFMSFLKPSLFQPTPSVGLRGPIRYITSPTFLPERTFRRSPVLFSHSSEVRPSSGMDMGQVVTVKQTPANGPGSPISRTHTRNPFQRHPSYNVPAEFANSFESPRLLTLPEDPISPRKVPLPSPSVDESIADII